MGLKVHIARDQIDIERGVSRKKDPSNLLSYPVLFQTRAARGEKGGVCGRVNVEKREVDSPGSKTASSCDGDEMN